MLQHIKDKIITVDTDDVLKDAREEGLDVNSIQDFRHMAPHYHRIEALMDEYRSPFINSRVLSGLTTGLGGFVSSLTFATIDTISLSLQLYWLSQRFAILNGFDEQKPLQQDKILNIYFGALGLNAASQATLKRQLLKAGAMAGSWRASNSIILRAIVNIGQELGKQISSARAGRLVPIFGGVVGATVNYSFARDTSDNLKKAYKRAYFEQYHQN